MSLLAVCLEALDTRLGRLQRRHWKEKRERSQSSPWKEKERNAGTNKPEQSHGSSSMLILGNGKEESPPQQLPRGEEERLRGSML